MTANSVLIVAATVISLVFATMRRSQSPRSAAALEQRTQGESTRASYAAVERMRRLIDVLPHSLLQLNARGDITVANSAAAAKFGIPVSDLIGKSFRDLVTEEYRASVLDRLAHGFEQQDAPSMLESIHCVGRDEVSFPADISVGPIILDRGVQLVLVIVDVSARHTWAAQLQHQQGLLEQRNTELANINKTAFQFVDSVSHDFRTPLTVIKEYASLLSDELLGDVNDEQKRVLAVIDNRVDDLNAMVDDMLDISKLESGILGVRRLECTIQAIFERVAPTLQQRAESQSVELHVEIPNNLPAVFGDPEKAGRAIINFGTNAIKFCGEPGQVKLSARFDEASQEVRIGVTDNGPGIPEEQISELYQRFKQLEQGARHAGKGFGLGLSIAKQLINLNFGRTGVESKIGQGSTFWFTIPVHNTSTILRRSLARAGQLSWHDDCLVSLIQANALGTNSSSKSELDELLQCRLRATEVCVPTEQDSWLLLLVRRKEELTEFVNDWEQLADEASMNRPAGPLPAVTFSTLECWPIDAVEESALSQVLDAISNPQVV